MHKLKRSVLHCFHDGCSTLPTIVLEFEALKDSRVYGQIITCSLHETESTSRGLGRYNRAFVNRQVCPPWLRRLHQEVINNKTCEGKPVDSVDVERVISFLSPRHPQERK